MRVPSNRDGPTDRFGKRIVPLPAERTIPSAVIGREHPHGLVAAVTNLQFGAGARRAIEPVLRQALGPDQFVAEILDAHLGLPRPGTLKRRKVGSAAERRLTRRWLRISDACRQRQGNDGEC
jgi:hypothetical protein